MVVYLNINNIKFYIRVYLFLTNKNKVIVELIIAGHNFILLLLIILYAYDF